MRSPRPLDHIGGIPTYVPGRPPNLHGGAEAYKLSSNENPFPPLPGVLEAAQGALESINRYPDMSCGRLYEALAARLDVSSDELAAGSGSVALIFHVLSAFCGPDDEVVHAWRSFEAYPIAITVAGAISVPVPVTSGPNGGCHDLHAMAEAINERTRVVLLCTPNNPTGTALTHSEVKQFLTVVPDDVLVVIDEAYAEFVRMHDALDSLELRRGHPNVVILRTFSKAYGLADLRVGFAIAHRDVIQVLRAVSIPFGVSNVAQAAAIASLAASHDLEVRVQRIIEQRQRLTDALKTTNWNIPASQGNFVWLELGAETEAFLGVAERVGLAVRAFPGAGIRATIGEQSAVDRLIDLLVATQPPEGARLGIAAGVT